MLTYSYIFQRDNLFRMGCMTQGIYLLPDIKVSTDIETWRWKLWAPVHVDKGSERFMQASQGNCVTIGDVSEKLWALRTIARWCAWLSTAGNYQYLLATHGKGNWAMEDGGKVLNACRVLAPVC